MDTKIRFLGQRIHRIVLVLSFVSLGALGFGMVAYGGAPLTFLVQKARAVANIGTGAPLASAETMCVDEDAQAEIYFVSCGGIN